MNPLLYISLLFGVITAQNALIPKFRLNSGRDCPAIGLGTGGFDGMPQGEQVKQMVRDAVDAGYRLFDTASYYDNEKAIGEALNELIAERKVRRDELFVSTKTLFLMGQNTKISRQKTAEKILIGLQNLNLTYLDLILFHYPSDVPEINIEVWKGFENALNLGWVKSIGVSNFNVDQLQSLIDKADVLPAMNQVESHPQMPQTEMLDFCAKYKIRMTAWSPLGGGTLVRDPIITGVGQMYNKTAAQVMLRYQYQRGVVVVPKSTKTERIRENIDIFDFELNENDMNILNNM